MGINPAGEPREYKGYPSLPSNLSAEPGVLDDVPPLVTSGPRHSDSPVAWPGRDVGGMNIRGVSPDGMFSDLVPKKRLPPSTPAMRYVLEQAIVEGSRQRSGQATVTVMSAAAEIYEKDSGLISEEKIVTALLVKLYSFYSQQNRENRIPAKPKPFNHMLWYHFKWFFGIKPKPKDSSDDRQLSGGSGDNSQSAPAEELSSQQNHGESQGADVSKT